MEIEPIAQEEQENRYFALIQIPPGIDADPRQNQTTHEDNNDPDYRSFFQPNRTDCEGKAQPRRSTRVLMMSAKALENLVDDT